MNYKKVVLTGKIMYIYYSREVTTKYIATQNGFVRDAQLKEFKNIRDIFTAEKDDHPYFFPLGDDFTPELIAAFG